MYHFSIAVTKYLSRSTYRRKGLFWLTVLEVSVHSQVPLLLGLWQGGASWWKDVVAKAANLMADGKQRDRRRVDRPDVPFKGTLPMTVLLQPGLSPNSPSSYEVTSGSCTDDACAFVITLPVKHHQPEPSFHP
jgi:hypothetical protein